MLRSLLFFGHVDAGGLEHQLFRAYLLERHLDERVAAHRRDRDHHAVAEGLVVDLIARGKLQHRFARGRLCRGADRGLRVRRARDRAGKAGRHRAAAAAVAAAEAGASTGQERREGRTGY